ncbi:YlbF family regulator [Ruminococcaceae bacterium OttesenSCG-928-D13]|nr:YlbF family regulator [Ruminococcaceae bacterium OttesenSCG-928-D13]
MDAITMFKEAAKALQQDERYLSLEAARKANDDNAELQDKIGEFNLVRLDLNNEIEKDERDDARVAELNDRINNLYNEIMAAPSMLAYNDAKQAMRPMVDYINAIITAAVDGEDPMTVTEPASGCGDGCASCAGCG